MQTEVTPDVLNRVNKDKGFHVIWNQENLKTLRRPFQLKASGLYEQLFWNKFNKLPISCFLIPLLAAKGFSNGPSISVLGGIRRKHWH